MRSSKRATVSRPVARSEGLHIESVGDETVVYDTESKEAHCLKPLAAAVFAYADGNHTAVEIAELAAVRLAAEIDESDVASAVDQLEQSGLLDAPLLVRDGVSRREMIRRVSWAGAIVAGSTPLITSIVAPTAAMAAASTIPTGCTGCGQNKDCASNHCCQSVSGKSCDQSCCVGMDNSCHISSGGVCTVVLSTCPCICGAPGCNLPKGQCCPPPSTVCCTPT